VSTHTWFGILLTLLYAVVLPLLVISAGIWAAEVGAARDGSRERRLGSGAQESE
jgi:hypothetical protein